jgi:hypothetical protein
VSSSHFPTSLPTPKSQRPTAVPHISLSLLPAAKSQHKTLSSSPTPLRLDRDDHLPRAEVAAEQLAAVPPEAPAEGFLDAALARRLPYVSTLVAWFSLEFLRIGARATRVAVSPTPHERGAETAPFSPSPSLLLSRKVLASSRPSHPMPSCVARN